MYNFKVVWIIVFRFSLNICIFSYFYVLLSLTKLVQYHKKGLHMLLYDHRSFQPIQSSNWFIHLLQLHVLSYIILNATLYLAHLVWKVIVV